MTILHTNHLSRNCASSFCKNFSNCSAKTTDYTVLLSSNNSTSLFCTFFDQLSVDRFDAVHIYNSCADSFCSQCLSSSDCSTYHQTTCDNGNVRTFSYYHTFTKLKFSICRMAIRSCISGKTDVHRLLNFDSSFYHPVSDLSVRCNHNVYARKSSHHSDVFQCMMSSTVECIRHSAVSAHHFNRKS